MKISTRIALIVNVIFHFSAASVMAMFKGPDLVPVDRLVKSAQTYVFKHPEDAQAHYTLARIHYLAFVTKLDQVEALPYGDDDGPVGVFGIPKRKGNDRPNVAPDWMRDRSTKAAATTLAAPQLIDHAARAMRSFNEALRLDPKNGLYALGFASLSEEFWNWNETAKPKELPGELQGITIRRFRYAYAKAFAFAMVEDSKLTEQPIEGIYSIVAHEAAVALVRLAEKAPETLSEQDKRDLKTAEEAVAKFKRLPRGWITPIVFSLNPAAHLTELLDPKRTVDFDLRGYGPAARWPWVKAELGFLVWDPLETGCVQSARQMFGSYTFQIFRRTGYDALAALDDNADGILSGAELAGLSVWFDRDGDGRATAGEVTPLRALGVVSIAVTATTHDGIHPTNPRGLTLRDGRTLPTWDWIVEPVR